MRHMTLLETIADEDILLEAWKRTYAGKSDDVREHSEGFDKESLADFKENDIENIKQISLELSTGIYTLSPLSGFEKEKKNGNFRLITAPTVRDRIVHASILAMIQQYYPEIRNKSSYCLPRSKEKSERVNFIDAFRMINSHIKNGNTYVFESDIESFFDKIVKKRLLRSVLTSLPDKSIDHLIKDIVYYEVGNLSRFTKINFTYPFVV